MNANEGLKRIATAVRWIGDGIAALIALGFIAASFNVERSWELALIGLATAGFPLVVGRVASWIILGFAEPKAPKS